MTSADDPLTIESDHSHKDRFERFHWSSDLVFHEWAILGSNQ
jgi:hypothetical protein